MARYLVTGGCGFIGSHLVKALLARGDEVRVLDNLSTGNTSNTPDAVELIVGDVCDADAVAAAMQDVDGCFHLAAIASIERCNVAWVDSHRTNLTGTITLLEAARQSFSARPVSFVYASSAAVYGDNTNLPLGEHAAAQPRSPYGADKLGSEMHAFAAYCVHGFSTVGLRFFNVYGPGQDPRSPYSGVISRFCERLCAGREVTIFGDGQQTRDFIYVADVVLALVAAMLRPRTGAAVVNVCTGRATAVLDLAFLIGDLLGVRPKIDFKPARRGDIRASIGDPSDARARLGFSAETELRSGLDATLSIGRARADPWLAQPHRTSTLASGSGRHESARTAPEAVAGRA
jgi:UDP-glucose 4-epimerase